MSDLEQVLESANEPCGIKFTTIEDGFVRSELTLKEEYFNFMGIVYGGCLYHLADVTAGIAFMSKGGLGATATGDMQFLRAAAKTKVLVCEARVVKYGKTLGFVQTDIMDENEVVLAKGTFVFCNRAKSE